MRRPQTGHLLSFTASKDIVLFINGGICNKTLLEQTIETADYVIHLAAEYRKDEDMTNGAHVCHCPK